MSDTKTKSASVEKFLLVAGCLKRDMRITPEILAEIIEMAARLDEIELEGTRLR